MRLSCGPKRLPHETLDERNFETEKAKLLRDFELYVDELLRLGQTLDEIRTLTMPQYQKGQFHQTHTRTRPTTAFPPTDQETQEINQWHPESVIAQAAPTEHGTHFQTPANAIPYALNPYYSNPTTTGAFGTNFDHQNGYQGTFEPINAQFPFPTNLSSIEDALQPNSGTIHEGSIPYYPDLSNHFNQTSPHFPLSADPPLSFNPSDLFPQAPTNAVPLSQSVDYWAGPTLENLSDQVSAQESNGGGEEVNWV